MRIARFERKAEDSGWWVQTGERESATSLYHDDKPWYRTGQASVDVGLYRILLKVASTHDGGRVTRCVRSLSRPSMARERLTPPD